MTVEVIVGHLRDPGTVVQLGGDRPRASFEIVVFAFAVLRKPLLIVGPALFEKLTVVGFGEIVDRVAGVGLKFLKADVGAFPVFPKLRRRILHAGNVLKLVIASHEMVFAEKRSVVARVTEHGG